MHSDDLDLLPSARSILDGNKSLNEKLDCLLNLLKELAQSDEATERQWRDTAEKESENFHNALSLLKQSFDAQLTVFKTQLAELPKKFEALSKQLYDQQLQVTRPPNDPLAVEVATLAKELGKLRLQSEHPATDSSPGEASLKQQMAEISREIAILKQASPLQTITSKSATQPTLPPASTTVEIDSLKKRLAEISQKFDILEATLPLYHRRQSQTLPQPGQQ